VSSPLIPIRSNAPALVLAAGCVTAGLTWLSLTTVRVLSQGALLALTLTVVIAAAVVCRDHRGPRRWLAVSGAAVALLPLLVVAAFLSVSDG
jgi:uncharacterized membrane protein